MFIFTVDTAILILYICRGLGFMKIGVCLMIYGSGICVWIGDLMKNTLDLYEAYDQQFWSIWWGYFMDKKSPNIISGFGTWTWGMDLLRNDGRWKMGKMMLQIFKPSSFALSPLNFQTNHQIWVNLGSVTSSGLYSTVLMGKRWNFPFFQTVSKL